MKSKRMHVVVDAETHQRLKTYSELTGIPMSRVAATALADWMETIGAARLEALTPRRRVDNLIEMPTAKVRGAAAGQT